MTQFFNVQMNLQDTPQVQFEQSGSLSSEVSNAGSEESFNSVLQRILPEKNTASSSPLEKTYQSNSSGIPASNNPQADSSLLANIFSKENSTLTIDQQLVQRTSNSPESPLPLKQTIFNDPAQLIASLPNDQTAQNNIDQLITSAPNGQQVLNETDSLIAPATTEQQVLNETDSLIPSAKTGQQLLNETDSLIASATTGQPALSTGPGETIPIIQKETPVFFNPTTGDLSEKNNQNEIFNTFNTQSKNKLNIFQETTSFGSNTKSLSDLQNIITQTNNTSQQRIYSEPTLPIGTTQSQQVITPQQGALLDRLQSIINNGNETGTLSIKNVTLSNSDESLRSQLAQLPPRGNVIPTSDASIKKLITRNGDSFTVLEEGVFAPSLRNKQQNLSGIRHDSNQQFFNAKIQPQNSFNDASNSDTNKQNDGMNQQGSGFNQLSSLTNKPESGAQFTLQGTTTADPLATQIPTDAKTTILPSGTLLHDQEVIQQLVDRFKVNRRQLESKIQLKLHPAELGKMEIDLTVKEGSIRANVVAQSQHVQEIVERNIAKLKSVLEQQGFNVEEIIVTSESEMVGSFDLFDQQLSKNDSSTFSKNNDKTENNTPFVLDEFQDSYLDASSGVNVKV